MTMVIVCVRVCAREMHQEQWHVFPHTLNSALKRDDATVTIKQTQEY